jgi:hypothetical protein
MSDNNTFSVISIINNSDLKQLEEISSLVSEKIKELKIKEEIKSYQEKIKIDGYCITQEEIEIPDTEHISLKYYVRMKAFDKEDKSDAEIYDHWKDEGQDPWYHIIGYDGPYDQNFQDYDGKFEYGDWDDPIFCKAYIFIYLYFFSDQKIPDTNSKFMMIVDEGEVLNLEMRDNTITVVDSGKVIDMDDFHNFYIMKTSNQK